MAGLGNPAQPRLPATPKRLGDQAQPRGKLPALRTSFGLTAGGDHRRSGDGPYAFDLPQPLGTLTLPSPLGALPVMTRESFL